MAFHVFGTFDIVNVDNVDSNVNKSSIQPLKSLELMDNLC